MYISSSLYIFWISFSNFKVQVGIIHYFIHDAFKHLLILTYSQLTYDLQLLKWLLGKFNIYFGKCKRAGSNKNTVDIFHCLVLSKLIGLNQITLIIEKS